MPALLSSSASAARRRGGCHAWQAWQTLHPPKRGAFWRRPRVHIGFFKSWTRNNLNLRVKERILQIFKDSSVAKHDFKLYITGAPPAVAGLQVHPAPDTSHARWRMTANFMPVHADLLHQVIHFLCALAGPRDSSWLQGATCACRIPGSSPCIVAAARRALAGRRAGNAGILGLPHGRARARHRPASGLLHLRRAARGQPLLCARPGRGGGWLPVLCMCGAAATYQSWLHGPVSLKAATVPVRNE